MSRTIPLIGAGDGESDPYAGYLLYDTFTDDDSTPLANHTPEKAPVGSVWADVEGSLTWTIASNKATCTAAGASVEEIDCGVSDVDNVLASVVPGNYFGVVARGTGAAQSYLLAEFRTTEDQLVILYNNGSYNDLATLSFPCDPTDTFTNFEFKVNGTALELLIDGVSKITTTSSFNLTETQIGLFGYAENGICTVDGLTVEAI